ncbi:MAG TPA: homoserine O-succinyltransferase [Steroidobacteraceae bacterium]|nr:homoserine O-succinyltransferase [Steroidobacteraceae bacterium]
MSCAIESAVEPGDPPDGWAAPVHRDGVLAIPGSFHLHHGGTLEGVHVAWRIAGAASGPVIAVLGGISAGRDVFGTNSSPESGWWPTMVGPGLAVDSERFRILGIDFLGGSGVTTGPRATDRTPFPSVSSYDQAALLERVLEHLGCDRLHAIVGASYGGMVGLAFAERFPQQVGRLIVVSAADRAHPLATAWRSIERRVVRFGATLGDAAGGLEIARALAMATYRSGAEFEQRFAGEPEWHDERAGFPVEQYLFARGAAYARSYVPEAFVCLSESIDLHQVEPARVTVPTTLVAIIEDQLVPIADMRALAARLGGRVNLVELSSIYGHDAFLKESERLTPVFVSALNEDRADA